MKWTPSALSLARRLREEAGGRVTQECARLFARSVGAPVTGAQMAAALQYEEQKRAAKEAAQGADRTPPVQPAPGSGIVPPIVSPPPVGRPPEIVSRRGEAYLIISDTQEPYAAPGAIAFCLAVAREFGVDTTQPGRVYHCGDEADLGSWSTYIRSPAHPNPAAELDMLRDRMRAWYAAFPHVRVCMSNHVERLFKRADEAAFPSGMMRAWREIIDAPPGWEWADHWIVRASKQQFMIEHGHHGPTSVNALRLRVLSAGMPVVTGHTWDAMTLPVRTRFVKHWGMRSGGIFDPDALAAAYGKGHQWQPCLGVGVVLDGGRMPIWVPYGGDWP